MLLNRLVSLSSLLFTLGVALNAHASISLDRTRVIYDAEDKAVSVTLKNNNTQQPYLAQSWLENSAGEKINNGPFIVLPPLQRLESNEESAIRLVKLPDGADQKNALAKDRESVFYLNVQEIPPKSKADNSLQIAIRSKIKLFYRPKGIEAPKGNPGSQLQLSLNRAKHILTLTNPTPYHISIAELQLGGQGKISKVDGLMLAPKSDKSVTLPQTEFGSLTLSSINDYGGQDEFTFSCQKDSCQLQKKEKE